MSLVIDNPNQEQYMVQNMMLEAVPSLRESDKQMSAACVPK